MQFLDKYGWPVERVKGRWFFNLIRIIIHTKKIREFPDFNFNKKWKTTSWLNRFCARHTARVIYRTNVDCCQVDGWSELKREYEMINTNKFQLIHWILREVGYDCCPAEIMEKCGVDPENDQDNQRKKVI